MNKQFFLLLLTICIVPLTGMQKASKVGAQFSKHVKRFYNTKKTWAPLPGVFKEGTNQQVSLEVSGDILDIKPRTKDQSYVEVDTTEEKVRVMPDSFSANGMTVLRFPKKKSTFFGTKVKHEEMQNKLKYSTSARPFGVQRSFSKGSFRDLKLRQIEQENNNQNTNKSGWWARLLALAGLGGAALYNRASQSDEDWGPQIREEDIPEEGDIRILQRRA